MKSKITHELRMLAAVTILTGTLVIGLEQFSRESVTNTVKLAQSSSFSTQRSPGPATERDARDTSRMDMRQQGSSLQGPSTGQVRSTVPPSGISGAVMEDDSRRDSGRMDTRYEMAPPAAPSAQAAH